MFWNETVLLARIEEADTEDLLDRITAYRAGMEPTAIEMIERELGKRGVSPSRITQHQDAVRQECIFLPDGTAVRCSQCSRPAVAERRGWHRLWGRIPLWPRTFRLCKVHVVTPT